MSSGGDGGTKDGAKQSEPPPPCVSTTDYRNRQKKKKEWAHCISDGGAETNCSVEKSFNRGASVVISKKETHRGRHHLAVEQSGAGAERQTQRGRKAACEKHDTQKLARDAVTHYARGYGNL